MQTVIHSPWPSLLPYPTRPVWAHLASTAARLPHKVALIQGDGQRSTFVELWDASCSYAAFLQREATVGKGEVVGISTEDTREFVAAMYGALMVGATVAAVSPLFGPRDLSARLEGVRAQTLIASTRTRAILAELQATGDLPPLGAVYPLEDSWRIAADQESRLEPVALDVNADLALLGYTGGTAGELPKAVPHTHAGETAAACQRAAVGRGAEQSVVLDLHPIWFTVQLTFLTGATCLEPTGLDPDGILQLAEREQATEIIGRPFSLETLLEAYDHRPRDLRSVQLVETSGTALPPRLARDIERRFDCPVRQAYHLSETAGTANRDYAQEGDPESVGFPVPDTEEKIVDLDSQGEVSISGIGELLIRGPQVATGYLGRPEETAERFLSGGWLRTGDLARHDERGRVYIVDRAKDMIKVYGRHVAPAEIEAVLREHPAVRDAAVIGVPWPGAGEVPKAFVVASEGHTVTFDELTTFVASRVAPFKIAHEMEFVSELPKGPDGKVSRRALAEQDRTRRNPPDPS